jgi:phosphatidylserine decarboxylase
MSIGHSPEQAAYTPDMKKEHVTREEREDAKRRIEGSLAPTRDEDTSLGGLDL